MQQTQDATLRLKRNEVLITLLSVAIAIFTGMSLQANGDTVPAFDLS